MSSLKKAAVTFAAAVVTLTITSCERDATTAPDQHSPSIESVGGVPSTEAEMRARLDRVTRLVALALADAHVRRYVYEQLVASRFREHKLHFAPSALQPGSRFSSGLTHAAGLTETAGLKGLLDSLIDLEFYMPVPRHRALWTGGDNLIVASALRDHEVPVAYDLSGRRVMLTSAEEPPATPTLAVVPRETDFSEPVAASAIEPFESEPSQINLIQLLEPCDPADPACSGAQAQVCNPGACMTFSHIPGDYEGFMMGYPEFEVHAITRPANSNTGTDYRCAGQHAPNPASRYDQNGSGWIGVVTLLSDGDLQTLASNQTRVFFQVWEDDAYACITKKDKNFLKAAENAVLSYFFFVATQVTPDCEDNQWCLVFNLALKGAIQEILNQTQSDDYVGKLVPIKVTGAQYSDANYQIINEKGRETGRVRIQGLGERPLPPPPSFTAEIVAPSQVNPDGTCTWQATLRSAPGPVSYTWFRNGVVVGSGQTYTIPSGQGGFDLQVAAEATTGEQGAADYVTVRPPSSGSACATP